MSTDAQTESVEQVTIRFAGDSGDGMQLTGERFTTTSAIMGNDISTVSDFPAEIRAPAGTTGGVSGFQLTFGSHDVFAAGDDADTLIAMNPAALKINIDQLKERGLLIVNEDGFSKRNWERAGYDHNPLEDDALKKYQVFPVPISSMTKSTLEGLPLNGREMDRCKNFFALGLTFWLYERELEGTLKWLDSKFAKLPDIAEANKRALRGGYAYGENSELFRVHYKIKPNPQELKKGTYRHITGNTALAYGLVAAAQQAELPLFLGSYPITPATDILQTLTPLKNFNVTTLQAEDEIAAIGAAIGAAFGGSLAATSTSGPGMALKSEFLNLAIMAELPLVVINVQRGGPSTGLPTKTEQADLLQVLWGRNGESPAVVLAPKSPSDCFQMAYEASRIAIKYMTPVILLSDGNLANGADIWKVPEVSSLPKFEFSRFKGQVSDFHPYERDPETLARPWVIPGTPDLEHRLGGLEKDHLTGAVSYGRENHHEMVLTRAEKVQRVTNEIPPQVIHGHKQGDLLVVGWGSTYGVIRTVVEKLALEGHSVGSTHLQFLNPLPLDLEAIFENYKTILVAEINNGQLWTRLQGAYAKPMKRFNRVKGYPLSEKELQQEILQLLKD
ncbi:MAG: 2-oxoacid:acceptor oxidoreductase subunit alpha [Bdellovibrionales bacterium]|nr:2-oxoacid:acceptor oxidoreductase subunit alpha [Bdellovibrionales bacterium]